MIKEIADKFEKEYGFMCYNGVVRAHKAMHTVGIHVFCEDLALVLTELMTRGWLPINTEQEYNDGVDKHGIPPAFDNAHFEEKFPPQNS